MVNADTAMYEAKTLGGDTWACYRADSRFSAPAGNHADWGECIDHALTHDGVALLTQPVVPLAHGERAQYELLLRMHDKQGNVISPGAFLPTAQRLGLIGAIDRWVVARAIDMLVEQRGLGHDLRLEINLSPCAIEDHEVLSLIERQLRGSGVEADRWCSRSPRPRRSHTWDGPLPSPTASPHLAVASRWTTSAVDLARCTASRACRSTT